MGRVLVLIALRNLWAHKTGSLIVGSIIFSGTFLFVLGSAMVDSVDHALARSITGSIAGHLQIYAADAEDQLNLFGGGMMGGAEFGVMREFGRIRRAVEAVPNVRAVVPMGLNSGLVVRGNEIDEVLRELRSAVAEEDAEQQAEMAHRLRNIAADLRVDLTNRLAIAADQAAIRASLVDLERIAGDAFWQAFAADPQAELLFLDSHIAPLALDGQLFYLRNLGTDVHRFVELFDRFEMVTGEMIPQGRRGLLLSERFYERRAKASIARDLDTLARRRTRFGETFAQGGFLASLASRLPRQFPRIKNQLSVDDARRLQESLRGLLPGAPGDLAALLETFLTFDDSNFAERYAFFYATIAPMIRLYELAVGDEIAVRTVTRSGYIKAVKLKIWGVYRFKGLEESDLAGAQQLVDMLSFRELYGVMTQAKQAELAGIRAAVDVEDVAKQDAEAALFGGTGSITSDESSQDFFEDEELVARVEEETRRYDQADIDGGLAISAAVLLDDPDGLRESQAAIEAVIAEQGLGLKVIDWQTAAGIIGQAIFVLRVVLFIATLIIFIVALVIINNAMAMATIERTPEVGTMRAMGAQRRFVLQLFLLETALLGVIAGTAGGALGVAVVKILGVVGWPAHNEAMVLFFSGTRLYPELDGGTVVASMVTVMLVSLIATLYPALIAARIQPVVAMQSKE